MADNIIKLKVDSQEYEGKIKRASQGLQELGRSLHDAGKTFADADEKAVEYARALGQMETVSKSARGKIGEMSYAFVELKKQYIDMSDAEKQSPIGQAMSKSLEELKTRTINAKQELADINKELNETGKESEETGGILGQLKDKFTINIDALKLFNVGLTAAKAALDVAKDAFFSSESNVDEWGRVVASSQSVYEGFLTAINTGDISGYLGRIDEIVAAARKAYDELDRLGTMKTIQAPQTDTQNAENIRMRTMLMTGRWISAADGRKSPLGLKDGDLLTPAQLKTIERQLQGGMSTIVSLTKNELDQTGRAIDAYYDKLAKQNGMTTEEFRKGTSSMAEFDKRIAGAKAYGDYQRQHTITDDRTGIRRYIGGANPYEQFKNWSTFRVDKQGANSYNELVGLIKQQQQQTSQLYSTIGQAYRTINRAEGTTVRNIMNGGSGGSGGGGRGGNTNKIQVELPELGSIDAQTKKVQELQKAWRAAADDQSRKDIKEQIEQAQMALDVLTGKHSLASLVVSADTSEAIWAIQQIEGVKIDPKDFSITADTAEALAKIQQIEGIKLSEKKLKITVNDISTVKSDIAEKSNLNIGEGLGKDFKLPTTQVEDMTEALKQQKLAFNMAGQAATSFGEALAGIEDPAAKAAGTVIQAIANVALGFGSAVAQASSMGPYAWIAYTAAAMGAMATAISTVHSLTGYAEGGIVKGNSYSGDNVPAMVGGYGGELVGLNAGELVLTKAQTASLAQQLQGNGGGGMHVVGEIQGEKIVLVANRFFKRTGQGEIVTW